MNDIDNDKYEHEQEGSEDGKNIIVQDLFYCRRTFYCLGSCVKCYMETSKH